MGRSQRSFGTDFKRQVVLELLSGETSAAALCRRYGFSAASLASWKKAYEKGQLEDGGEADEVEALKERIRNLEAVVAQLSLENQFLKKTAARARQHPGGKPSIITGAPSPSEKRAK